MNTSIPKNIKRLRQQAGLTQEQLAEKLFVTRQTVSLWENGKTQPDVQTLDRIAAVFQVDLMTVLYGTAKRSDEKGRVLRWLIVLLAGYGLLKMIELLTWNVLVRFDGFDGFWVDNLIRFWIAPSFFLERGFRLAKIWQIGTTTFVGWKKWLWEAMKIFCSVYLAMYIGTRLWLSKPTSGFLSLLCDLQLLSTYFPWIFLVVGYCLKNCVECVVLKINKVKKRN